MTKKSNSMSIAALEGENWAQPGPDAPEVVLRCYELRHKPIDQLQPSELRVLIGQDIALAYLVPIAIDLLERNPLVETEYYRGDLLAVLLRASSTYFHKVPDVRKRVEDLIDSIPKSLRSLDDIDLDISVEALDQAVALFRAGTRLV